MLSDTVSMAIGADRTRSFSSFIDGFGGVASSCYDDSDCDAFVEQIHIQSFLDASPPPLTPPTSSLTDRKYTDTSLLPFPKIQCPTDVSSIQSTDTTIDDQWNIADSISQKYLTKNILTTVQSSFKYGIQLDRRDIGHYYQCITEMQQQPLLCMIITNEGSFTVLQDWIAELHRLGPPNIVLAIAGNKCDLEDKREV
uniref:Uncharacterized protein n=1 Tax=Amphimedon queenslandica TaxID=400682 RepID=A0A1X7TAS0_AMPQE